MHGGISPQSQKTSATQCPTLPAMQDIALLAIDWGTSSTRLYAMDRQGLIRDARSAPLGVQRVANGEFAKALKTLCGDDFPEDVPAIACGMIGSRQGWVEGAVSPLSGRLRRDCGGTDSRSRHRAGDRARSDLP